MTEAQEAALRMIALINTHRPRNGIQSAENQHSDKLVTVIERFFDVKRANVNDQLKTDETLRRFLNL